MPMDHRTPPRNFAPLLIASAMILFQGCISTPPPTAVHYPITSGSHETLPSSRDVILVWGEEPLTNLAVEWLIAHHYAALIRPESEFSQTKTHHTFSERTLALSVAKRMEADFVLFLDREESKHGALVETRCDAQFSVDVIIRGVSVPSGAVVLGRNAHYPHCVDLSRRTLQNLTCQALATAWGFRSSGQLEIPSSLMCTVGQTRPGFLH
ncbi:MAG: hypothetical protein ABI955_04335 [Nitrospirota bacterium]